MTRRKPLKEIEKDISQILNKFNSDEELLNNIDKYLNNLTGKELVPKIRVRNFFLINTMQSLTLSKVQKEKIIKQFDNNIPLKIRSKFQSHLQSNPGELLLGFVMDKILSSCKRFKKIIIENPHADDLFLYEKDLALQKFVDFIEENLDVAELLKEFIIDIEEEIILEQIITKQIPLRAINKYFDTYYSIKENTNQFYTKLEKQFSKNDIQNTFSKWIRDKEKKSKK